MKTVVPDYYSGFRCIADKCKNSCCVGWEIDVDEKSYEYYKGIKGSFGKALCESIEGNPPHFKTVGKDERCPHLNEKGLCNIIINLGEEALCQICSDHPRFRNYFSDRVETGLGLCCEEAARIIVTRKEKTVFLQSFSGATPEEDSFFKLRQRIFDIVQNRNEDIWTRLDILCKMFGITVGNDLSVFDRLEYMDDVLLSGIHNTEGSLPKGYDTCFEQLAVYFIYRHLADGMEYGDIPERIRFSTLSVRVIAMLSYDRIKNGESPLEAIADVSRIYSAEIEYSEDNVNELLDCFL